MSNRGRAWDHGVEYVTLSVVLPQTEGDALTSRVGNQSDLRGWQAIGDRTMTAPRTRPWRADPRPLANSAATTSDHSVFTLRLRHSSIGETGRATIGIFISRTYTFEKFPEKRLEYEGGHDGRIR